MTLDVSSANNHIRTRKSATDATPSTKNTEDATNPPDVTTQQEGQTPDEDDTIMSDSNGDKEGQPPPEEPLDRIQILDLHSSNPIISYQNQIYSCEWTSTIGTDVLLTTPDPDFPHPILKEEEDVTVIAATGIKLLGRPAQLAPRPSASAEDEPTNPTNSAPESSSTPASGTPVAEKPTKIKIPAHLAASKAREKQAAFLERLMAVKTAKGEEDEVTIYTDKANQRSGWRSQKKAEKAMEEQRASEAHDSEPTGGEDGAPTTRGTRGRPRGGRVGRPRRDAWRIAGPRTQKGGLFRDYRPHLFDTEGADIRNDPSPVTPDSWDQLYQSPNADSPNEDDPPLGQSTSSEDRINTPTYHPQASSPKTAPALAAAPPHSPQIQNQNPSPPPEIQPQPQPQPPKTTTTTGGTANAYTSAATVRVVVGPSRDGGGVDGGGGEGERSEYIDVEIDDVEMEGG